MSRYSLTVRGKRRRWSFEIAARPEYLEAWRADGLDVDEIVEEVPDGGLAGRLQRQEKEVLM